VRRIDTAAAVVGATIAAASSMPSHEPRVNMAAVTRMVAVAVAVLTVAAVASGMVAGVAGTAAAVTP
jgi:hypothetical protein